MAILWTGILNSYESAITAFERLSRTRWQVGDYPTPRFARGMTMYHQKIWECRGIISHTGGWWGIRRQYNFNITPTLFIPLFPTNPQ